VGCGRRNSGLSAPKSTALLESTVIYQVVRSIHRPFAPSRHSAIDGRTTRHVGYAISQRKRPLVEEIFGWMKTIGGFRRTRFIGLARTQLAGYFVASAYNLVRIARLMPTVTAG